MWDKKKFEIWMKRNSISEKETVKLGKVNYIFVKMKDNRIAVFRSDSKEYLPLVLLDNKKKALNFIR